MRVGVQDVIKRLQYKSDLAEAIHDSLPRIEKLL